MDTGCLGSGGVPIPEGVPEPWECGTWGRSYGGDGLEPGLGILQVFNDSVMLVNKLPKKNYVGGIDEELSAPSAAGGMGRPAGCRPGEHLLQEAVSCWLQHWGCNGER